MYTWGYNRDGQLGIGSSDYNAHSTPIKISLPNGVKPTQIAGGNNYSMVIGDDGNLYTWGYNGSGQLGDGTTITKTTPTKISLSNGIKPKIIEGGYSHAMMIGSDEELYTWGDNYYGQLGDSTTTNKKTPTKITLASNVKVKQVDSGENFTIALGSNGELYSWGRNQYGELGDGTNTQRNSPVKVTLASGIKPTQIACGYYFAMAIGSDDNLYAWGWNENGNLGDETSTSKSIPTKINFSFK